MQTISAAQLPALFRAVGTVFQEKKDELCALDARLGDGDLGLTMSKGFGALPELLEGLRGECGDDVGKLLMKGGMKMASLVPSTMGFLMSSGVMEGGKALRGAAALDAAGLAAFLTGFAAGVQKRGKCEAGQRTLYDALLPAAEAAEQAAQAAQAPDAGLESVITAALAAAAQGVEATKTMTPVFGKAAVHAAQAQNTPDQGALAGYYLLLGLKAYICG